MSLCVDCVTAALSVVVGDAGCCHGVQCLSVGNGPVCIM